MRTFTGAEARCALGVALIMLALAFTLLASFAQAKGGGQIGEAFGTPGVGNGQFFNPQMFGADPVDGTLYTGDYTGPVETESSNYRIQQLSASGEFKASAEIKRFPEAKKIIGLQGIAVDHSLGRIYMVETCRVSATVNGTLACKEVSSRVAARKILVYSTTPESGKLVAQTPITLPSGEQEIYEPRAITVDPSNHDLLILGEEGAHHKIVQRISSGGTLGARYTDTADKLKPTGGGSANVLAVGPDGTAYTMTGSLPPGSVNTRAWQLNAGLTTLEAVPGFSAAAEKENWPSGLEFKVEQIIGSPQLAISSDGSTLYWKEAIEKSEEKTPGNMVIRAFNLAKDETTAIWGGGATRCKIQTSGASLAATTGGNLAVFDYGAVTSKTTETPAYGLKVMTFGSSGSGCAEPVAKFTVNGKKEGEEVTGVNPGESVSFNASSSELAGGFRKEVIWKFGDGTEKVLTQPSESEEAAASTTHTYTTAAKYTVTLEIKLKSPFYGDPTSVSRSFTVGTPATGPKLKVTRSGSGTGSVVSSPAGIDCGSTCEAEFANGTEVTLTATAEEGSKFSGWSGAGCSGTGSCKVKMSEAKAVTAQFAAIPKFTLSLLKSGAGDGTVTSSPAGINCGLTCEAEFEQGKEVTLSASPGANSIFAGWSGAGCSGTGTCKVTMSEAKEVAASFALEQHALKVKVSGTGTGTVTSSPSGISCNSGTCEANFDHGAVVTLKGTSGAHSKAVTWIGCNEVVAGECKVTMTAAKEVIASFALEQHSLKATKTGSGTGTVTSTPAAINCGGTCEANFDHGAEVTLTATPDGGSKFSGWSGAGCTGTGSCKVTMTEAKEVTATFALEQHPLKVEKSGAGTGTVTSSPAGINCGGTCEASFDHGTEVTLTATPESGSKFSGWSGAGCSGTGSCKVTMTAAKEVTAEFGLLPGHFGVKVTVAGNGTVTSSPSGINCGVNCEQTYEDGEEVVLTAAPASNWKFSGWSGGGCSGTGSCKVSASAEVTATFALEQHSLRVTKTGSGTGTVTSSPAGINCGGTCEASFDQGTAVTLTAAAAAGSSFGSWSGCDAVVSGQCQVTMTAAKAVTASFTANPPPEEGPPPSPGPSPGPSPSPAPSGPTPAEQLQAALKKCRKLKNKKARARCVKRAKAKAKASAKSRRR